MYVGSWKDDDMHGEGTFCFAYGGFMLGRFTHNKINGTTYLQFPNENTILGNYKNGLLDGHCLKFNKQSLEWQFREYRKGKLIIIKQTGLGNPPISITILH